MQQRLARIFLFCVALASSGCAVAVAGGLDEGDANRVVVALDQAGIDATKEVDPTVEGKFRVTVLRDDAARALGTMAEDQLPRPKVRGVLEAADRGQLVPSQAAEHAQLIVGLSGELERTLGNVDGVLSARVHLNLPPKDSLREGPSPKATASVLLEHRGTTPPLPTESIQDLVAGGAPSLASSDVVVVFVPHATRQTLGRAEIVHVGPIAVARGSSSVLKIACAVVVLVILAFGALSLALYMKLLRVRRELEEGVAHATRTPSVAPPGARP
jgi:type III secretion protein J